MVAAPSVDLNAVLAYFEQQDDVLFALLFGSQARGTAGPLSDVDVAVMLPDAMGDVPRFRRRLELIVDLAGVLRTDEIDVAVINDVPLALRYRIYRDGVLLGCRDRGAFVRSKSRTVVEYLDFLPLAERNTRTFFRRAAAGKLPRGSR